MLVFTITKDGYDRYGLWKTFLGDAQLSTTEMVQFGKWAVFKPVGILVQATIVDLTGESDAPENRGILQLGGPSQKANPSPSNSSSSPPPQSATQPPTPPPPPPPPPVPPPPPPISTPPSGINGILKSSSSFGRLKCKRLSWKVIHHAGDDTIWNKINERLTTLGGPVDESDCLQHFKEEVRTPPRFMLGDLSDSYTKIIVLDGKKQLNISIALAHQQIEASILVKAVEDADAALLNSDFLSTIENFLPDQKEAQQLSLKFSSYSLPEEEGHLVTDPEEFAYLLSKVKNFRKKVHAMSFQSSFMERITVIEKNLDVISNASREIKTSTRLQNFLMYILSTGNIMNGSSTKAFKLDLLNKIASFKTQDKSSSVLLYIVSEMSKKQSELLYLKDDLPNLDMANRVCLNDIDRDVTGLAVEFEAIEEELISIKDECQKLCVFMEEGRENIDSLKKKRRNTHRELSELVEYFGEDPSKMTATDIFIICKEFLKDLSSAMEKIERKSSETLNKYASIGSFINKSSSSTNQTQWTSKENTPIATPNISRSSSREGSISSKRGCRKVHSSIDSLRSKASEEDTSSARVTFSIGSDSLFNLDSDNSNYSTINNNKINQTDFAFTSTNNNRYSSNRNDIIEDLDRFSSHRTDTTSEAKLVTSSRNSDRFTSRIDDSGSVAKLSPRSNSDTTSEVNHVVNSRNTDISKVKLVTSSRNPDRFTSRIDDDVSEANLCPRLNSDTTNEANLVTGSINNDISKVNVVTSSSNPDRFTSRIDDAVSEANLCLRTNSKRHSSSPATNTIRNDTPPRRRANSECLKIERKRRENEIKGSDFEYLVPWSGTNNIRNANPPLRRANSEYLTIEKKRPDSEIKESDFEYSKFGKNHKYPEQMISKNNFKRSFSTSLLNEELHAGKHNSMEKLELFDLENISFEKEKSSLLHTNDNVSTGYSRTVNKPKTKIDNQIVSEDIDKDIHSVSASSTESFELKTDIACYNNKNNQQIQITNSIYTRNHNHKQDVNSDCRNLDFNTRSGKLDSGSVLHSTIKSTISVPSFTRTNSTPPSMYRRENNRTNEPLSTRRSLNMKSEKAVTENKPFTKEENYPIQPSSKLKQRHRSRSASSTSLSTARWTNIEIPNQEVNNSVPPVKSPGRTHRRANSESTKIRPENVKQRHVELVLNGWNPDFVKQNSSIHDKKQSAFIDQEFVKNSITTKKKLNQARQKSDSSVYVSLSGSLV